MVQNYPIPELNHGIQKIIREYNFSRVIIYLDLLIRCLEKAPKISSQMVV